jgi:hypothetical protein
MKRDLCEMSDDELLAFTRPMDAATDMREVICVDCGEVFEVPKREWNVRRCPKCRVDYTKAAWARGCLHNDHRRDGDGLKNGLLKRVR